MGIIKTSKLVHEFIRRDEEGNVESITTALDNVNLDIKEGQFIAILGHNGSGKSTLAKHINALLAPSDGTIWVDGMDVSKEENVIPVRKSAGMVFQNPDNQIIANVVEEDVGFGPENIGVPTDEIWQRVDYALRAVGMTKYRTHSPNKLSGGQKQRVAIAGVVAMEPKCFVEQIFVNFVSVMKCVSVKKRISHLAVPDFVDIFLACAGIAGVKIGCNLFAVKNRNA